MSDTTIFNLRYGANVKLEPSHEELKHFLESKKEGTREIHADDLASYWKLLAAVADYKARGTDSFRDKMLYAVLTHSHFAKPALKSAIEQYKFHLHDLSKFDFKKPIAFIKSAGEEIARLNPKRKDEAVRIERMQAMIEERKKTLETLKKKWVDIAEELSNIISYITGNLGLIEKLCEKSIEILVKEQIDRKKETDLIEEIKIEFRERLRDALHSGTITKDDLEAAKEEVAELSKRTAELARTDIYAMTQMYESLHEHAGNTLRDLDIIVKDIRSRKHAGYEDDLELYSRAERVLLSLVSGCRLEIQVTEIGVGTANDKLLTEVRKGMLDHLVEQLQKKS